MFSIKNLFIFVVSVVLSIQPCHPDYHLLFAGKINDKTYFEIGKDQGDLGSAFSGKYATRCG